MNPSRTRCLTNIASSYSRHTQTILGAAPQLISFLSTPNPALQGQALWALGNIAGDSSDFREMLRANGALLPIFRLLQHPPVCTVSAAWVSSSVCVLCPPFFVYSVRSRRASRRQDQRAWGQKLQCGSEQYVFSFKTKSRTLPRAPEMAGSIRGFIAAAYLAVRINKAAHRLLSSKLARRLLTSPFKHNPLGPHTSPPNPRTPRPSLLPHALNTVGRDRTNSGVGSLQPRARGPDSWQAFR